MQCCTKQVCDGVLRQMWVHVFVLVHTSMIVLARKLALMDSQILVPYWAIESAIESPAAVDLSQN